MSPARLATCLVSCVVALCACGGRQAVDAEPVDRGDAPCCLEPRWEEPPPEIGQTPPDRPAPEGAIEPFQPDSTTDDD